MFFRKILTKVTQPCLSATKSIKPSLRFIRRSVSTLYTTLKAKKEEVLVVGDRLYTDIACGINAEVDTAVVFTGEAKKEELLDTIYKPDYVFEHIKDLYEALKEAKQE